MTTDWPLPCHPGLVLVPWLLGMVYLAYMQVFYVVDNAGFLLKFWKSGQNLKHCTATTKKWKLQSTQEMYTFPLKNICGGGKHVVESSKEVWKSVAWTVVWLMWHCHVNRCGSCCLVFPHILQSSLMPNTSEFSFKEGLEMFSPKDFICPAWNWCHKQGCWSDPF